MNKQFKSVKCTINGREVENMVDVRASLADMLRGEYELTSVKEGCRVGECGACTVLIDGETFNSCIYLAVWADGKIITTTEGLAAPDGKLSAVQQAFIDEGAVQCGFCTPGFLLSATELVNEKKKTGRAFTDDEIRTRLSGHLCRCTGYENIFKAVKKVVGTV
jgi:carbon-monoxide dehydrogenase small subunit